MAGSDGGGGSTCPGTLPEVAIRFDGCDAFTACGGDPTGTWVYQDICAADLVPDATSVCAMARVEDLMGTARGCVALDGANVARDVSGEISATIVVPLSCTFGMGCGPIETALSVTCTESGGECRCPYSTSWSENSSDTYTIAGNTLTTGDGTAYDFCVAGSALTYVESGAAAAEPGIVGLTR